MDKVNSGNSGAIDGWVVCGALIVMLCLGMVSGKTTNAAESHIKQVESGLLPMAAIKLGDTANIEDQMRKYGVPGVSVAVINDGRLAWARGYGVADSRTSEPVTTDTLFQAASISKPLAALGALTLVDSGKLNLDEDVNRYLKDWKIPDSKFTQSEKVTLRRLLSHTAGVADIVNRPNAIEQSGIPTLLQVLNGEPPASNFPIVIDNIPGKSHAYSKGGYVSPRHIMQEGGHSLTNQPRSRKWRRLDYGLRPRIWHGILSIFSERAVKPAMV